MHENAYLLFNSFMTILYYEECENWQRQNAVFVVKNMIFAIPV